MNRLQGWLVVMTIVLLLGALMLQEAQILALKQALSYDTRSIVMLTQAIKFVAARR